MLKIELLAVGMEGSFEEKNKFAGACLGTRCCPLIYLPELPDLPLPTPLFFNCFRFPRKKSSQESALSVFHRMGMLKIEHVRGRFTISDGLAVHGPFGRLSISSLSRTSLEEGVVCLFVCYCV
jgi:hypothetical protein